MQRALLAACECMPLKLLKWAICPFKIVLATNTANRSQIIESQLRFSQCISTECDAVVKVLD